MEIKLEPVADRIDLFILSIHMNGAPTSEVRGSYNDTCGAQVCLDDLHKIIPVGTELSGQAVTRSKKLINQYVEKHPEIYGQRK